MWTLLFCPRALQQLKINMFWAWHEANISYRFGNKPYTTHEKSIEKWNKRWK